MDKNDLVGYSPVRFFDKIADGGLKEGEIGLVTSKKGLGKTAVLVQFGLDAMLQSKQLVHVSFDQHSSNIIAWYDSIFSEIAKQKNIADNSELKNSINKERTILNFNQETFTLPRVIKTLKALKEGGISVSSLVIDGLVLDGVSKDDVKAVADFAKEEKIVVWFSDTKDSNKLEDTCSAELLAYFDCVCHIESDGKGLQLNMLKLRNKESVQGSVSLDTKTLLMSAK